MSLIRGLFKEPRFLLLFFFVIAFISTAAAVNAITIEHLGDFEEKNDFVLGPAKVEVFINPGESVSRELTVINRLGRDSYFTVSIEDFIGSSDPAKTTVLLGDEIGPYSLRDYVHPETRRFRLGNGDEARISIRVSIPADAEPGGRYGAVLIAAESADEATEGGASGAKISTRLGTLFFVRISGDVVENGFLKNFRTIGRSVFSSAPIPFELLFENSGNVHLTPYGLIEITNMWGKKVDEIPVDPWFSMPDSLRFREIRWGSSFLFGRYVAHAAVNRGYSDVVDTAEAAFWVIPWGTAGVGLALLAAIFGSVKYFRQRSKITKRNRR